MKRWIAMLLAVVLLLTLCACGKDKKPAANKPTATTTTGGVTTTTTDTNTTTTTTTASATGTTATLTNIPDEKPEKRDDIVNIALFGIDQAEGTVGRSDAVMILSIDYKTNTVKVTSLARDSLVPIAGHGEEKLAHAWAYGGVDLALSTVNNAFGMHLSDYVYVNFEDFVGLIDQLGGVEITVNELELNAINYGVSEDKKLPGVGKQRLDGEQALRYVRCRTDSDANRTSRQRVLMQAVLNEAQKLSAVQAAKLIGTIRDMCHTNLSNKEVTKFLSLLTLKPPSWEEMSLPDARLKAWSGILDRARGWVYVYDLEYAAALLYDFIYDEDTAEALPKPTQYQPQ